MDLNILLIISILVLIVLPKTIIINKNLFFFIFILLNPIVYFVNTHYLKHYFIDFGILIFGAPFLYYFFYIKLNVGDLNLSFLKPHLLISTIMLIICFYFSNSENYEYFNILIIVYFLFNSYQLIQLLITNYMGIYNLLKNDMQTIHNAVLITFMFYFSFIICLINLIYKNEHFNLFFFVFFIFFIIFYIWSLAQTNLKKMSVAYTFLNLKSELKLEDLTILKKKKYTIDFSFNWIKSPVILKDCDQNSILGIEPYISIYFEKLDSIHELPYNTFFNSPDLSMLDFSNECNIPINHLRFLFKNYSKISFHEFKRMCQIKNAVYLIDNNYLKKDTLEALSKKTGFLSYSSFYVNFKKFTKLLPLEYLKRN